MVRAALPSILVKLPQLDEEILAMGLGFQIIVVDDNSPDGTGALADQLSQKYPVLSVIHRPGKLGLGTAYQSPAGLNTVAIRAFRHDLAAFRFKGGRGVIPGLPSIRG